MEKGDCWKRATRSLKNPAMMASFLAMLVLIVSAMLPWYYIELEADIEMDYTIPIIGLRIEQNQSTSMDLEFNYLSAHLDQVDTLEDGSSKSDQSDFGYIDNAIAAKFETLRVVVVATIVLAVLAGMFARFFMADIARNKKKRAHAFGVLALVLCLLVPIFFMSTVPSSLGSDIFKISGSSTPVAGSDFPTQSFQGENQNATTFVIDILDNIVGGGFVSGLVESGQFNVSSASIEWGPGLGWYLPFISCGLMAMALVLSIFSGKREENIKEEERSKHDASATEQKSCIHAAEPEKDGQNTNLFQEGKIL